MENLTPNPYIDFLTNNKERLDSLVYHTDLASKIRFLGEVDNNFYFYTHFPDVGTVKLSFDQDNKLNIIYFNGKKIELVIDKLTALSSFLYEKVNSRFSYYKSKFVPVTSNIIDNIISNLESIGYRFSNYYFENTYYKFFLPSYLSVLLSARKEGEEKFVKSFIELLEGCVNIIDKYNYGFSNSFTKLLNEELHLTKSEALRILNETDLIFIQHFLRIQFLVQKNFEIITCALKNMLDNNLDMFFASLKRFDDIKFLSDDGAFEYKDFVKMIDPRAVYTNIFPWISSRLSFYGTKEIYDKLCDIEIECFDSHDFINLIFNLASKFGDDDNKNFIVAASLMFNARYFDAFIILSNYPFSNPKYDSLKEALMKNYSDEKFLAFSNKWTNKNKFSLTDFYKITPEIIYLNARFFIKIDKITYLSALLKLLDKEISKKNVNASDICYLLASLYEVSPIEYEKVIKNPLFNEYISTDFFEFAMLNVYERNNNFPSDVHIFKE